MAKNVYQFAEATKNIAGKLTKSVKKKIPKNDIAVILFLLDLYRWENGLVTEHEYFPELSDPTLGDNFVEKEEAIVQFVCEISEQYCFPLTKKVIEKVWELEMDYMLKKGIAEESENN